jgi:hypothetical protein
MPDEIRDEREYTREEMREACRNNYNAALATFTLSQETVELLRQEVETRSRRTMAAVAIADYLHTLDLTAPLAWHMARGLAERLAGVVTDVGSNT